MNPDALLALLIKVQSRLAEASATPFVLKGDTPDSSKLIHPRDLAWEVELNNETFAAL